MLMKMFITAVVTPNADPTADSGTTYGIEPHIAAAEMELPIPAMTSGYISLLH
jgi:hypothetical protein